MFPFLTCRNCNKSYQRVKCLNIHQRECGVAPSPTQPEAASLAPSNPPPLPVVALAPPPIVPPLAKASGDIRQEPPNNNMLAANDNDKEDSDDSSGCIDTPAPFYEDNEEEDVATGVDPDTQVDEAAAYDEGADNSGFEELTDKDKGGSEDDSDDEEEEECTGSNRDDDDHY